MYFTLKNKRKISINLATSALVIILVFTIMSTYLMASEVPDVRYGPHIRPPVMAQNGMVSSNNILASQAGITMLEKGGTVADAMLAVETVLPLTSPGRTSIAGAGFGVMWVASEGKVVGIDYNGEAPSHPELMERAEETRERYSIGGAFVPGQIGGLLRLHERYGKLPLSEVFAPAIRLATTGTPITELVSGRIKEMKAIFELIPTTADILLPHGRPPESGEVYYNPNYAKTLKLIAEGGYDAFYKGPIAREVARFYKEQNGFLTYESFASYEPIWVEPIHTTYRGYDIYALPPTSRGTSLLEGLNILEGIDLKSMDYQSADYMHLMLEVFKLVWADGYRYHGDMRFVDVPVDRLISKEYADLQRERIDMEKASAPSPGISFEKKVDDTTHAVVADQYGNILTCTLTTGTFGNGIMVGNLGFLIRSGTSWFNLIKGDPDELAPGKRPQTDHTPFIMFRDGRPILAMGGAGSTTIWQNQIQMVVNIVDFGMNPQQSVSIPRFVIRNGVDLIRLDQTPMDENYWTSDLINELEKRGHKIDYRDCGEVNGIMFLPSGVMMGAADPRRDGFAIGW